MDRTDIALRELRHEAGEVPVAAVGCDLPVADAKNGDERGPHLALGRWNLAAIGQLQDTGVPADPNSLDRNELTGLDGNEDFENRARKRFLVPLQHRSDPVWDRGGTGWADELRARREARQRGSDVAPGDGLKVTLCDGSIRHVDLHWECRDVRAECDAANGVDAPSRQVRFGD